MTSNEEVRIEDDSNLLQELKEAHFEILLSYRLKLIFIGGPKLGKIQPKIFDRKSCLTERKVRR